MPPSVGDPAPEFEALLCDGEVFRSTRLSDVADPSTETLDDGHDGDADGAVLVFSAFSFSAIAENWWKRFHRAGWAEFPVPVVGVSRDGPYAQNAFIRETAVPFALFADVDGDAGRGYDLLVERAGMANTTTPWRAVFVVHDGTIAYAWVADDWISPVPREAVEAAVAETFEG